MEPEEQGQRQGKSRVQRAALALILWLSGPPPIGGVSAAGRAAGGARASGFAPVLLAIWLVGARGGRQGAAERGLRRDALAWARQLRSRLGAQFSVRRVI